MILSQKQNKKQYTLTNNSLENKTFKFYFFTEWATRNLVKFYPNASNTTVCVI